MDMPKPSEAHRKLHRIAGSWLGEETMYPSPWCPSITRAEGYSSCRVGLDGFAVIGDYEQKQGDTVTYRGHSVFTYDPEAQCYLLYWWDSMGNPVNVFRGTLFGDVLTLTMTGHQGYSRLTYDLSDKAVLKTRMENSQDGRNWHNFMDGAYKRRDAGA